MNDRDTNRCATEGVNLTCFAWNSAPCVGTDISRSLIVKGREFQFPIDYSSDYYTKLTSTPDSVTNYAKQLANLLGNCRDVAKTLIEEHRAWHREYRNSQLPDPKSYQIGDFVFARRAVKSDKSKGRVAKTQYAHTGPWEIIDKLSGGSYQLRHCKSHNLNKKHSSDLTPCPRNLVPFPPVHGADNSYGQIHKQISKHSYLDAGVDEILPAHPLKVPVAFASLSKSTSEHQFEHFPSLSELNDELGFWPHNSISSDDDIKSPIMDTFTGVLGNSFRSLNNSVEIRDLDTSLSQDHSAPSQNI